MGRLLLKFIIITYELQRKAHVKQGSNLRG